MIDFSTLKGLTIPEGVVTQIDDAAGNVLWKLAEMVAVTITSEWNGMTGDTATITIISPEPFAPDPANPSSTTTSWTAWVYDQPDCTIELPAGSTIRCTVSRDKGNAASYISLNGTKVVTGEGTYLYTVTRDVTVNVADKYSQGDYGMITITEQ